MPLLLTLSLLFLLSLPTCWSVASIACQSQVGRQARIFLKTELPSSHTTPSHHTFTPHPHTTPSHHTFIPVIPSHHTLTPHLHTIPSYIPYIPHLHIPHTLTLHTLTLHTGLCFLSDSTFISSSLDGTLQRFTLPPPTPPSHQRSHDSHVTPEPIATLSPGETYTTQGLAVSQNAVFAAIAVK